MKSSILLGVAAVALVAAAPASAQSLFPFPGLASPSQSTQSFRAEALRSDAYEIESSRIALRKSRDPQVRAFARQMIEDHQKTTDALLPTGTSLNATGNVVSDNQDSPFSSPIGILTAPLTIPINLVGRTFEGKSLIDNQPGTPGRRVALDPRRQEMLAQLDAAPGGRRFKAAYATQQVRAHGEAVNLYRGYAQNGDSEAGRTFASQALPALEGHYAHASRLEQASAIDEPAF